MPTDSENVRLSAQNGSDRRTVRTTRLTPTRTLSEFHAPRRLARKCELTEINMACLFRCVDAVPSIPREVLMRILALAILTTVTVLTAAPILAQTYSPDYPVCLQAYRWGGSDFECGYTSLAQCAMSASGRSAECIINPYFASAQVPREPHYRRHRRVY
jgi:uncharacterized protein DUF3551